MNHPSKELLFRILRCDARTGRFVRLVSRGPAKAGDIAGSVDGNGYILISVIGQKIKAHRLAWFFAYGKWPTFEIDHINGSKTDNRLSNLREATRSQNCQNRQLHKNNTSGLKGIHLDKKSGKWVARIQIGNTRKHLGYRPDIKSAEHKIKTFRESCHGAFANHGERRDS